MHRKALEVMSEGLDPAGLIIHIGGFWSVPDATLYLPKIPGGKKLIYTHFDFPLTAISDFIERGNSDALFPGLHEICARHHGLWDIEAEEFLLGNG